MKESRVRELHKSVQWIADNFTDIATGQPNEFKNVVEVRPISDSGAIAIFQKASTNKQALALFLYLQRESRFVWWFPSDSDLLFLARTQAYREKVEGFNSMVISQKTA